MSLKDRVVVMIGGSGHLCSVLGQALHEQGAQIVVLDLVKPARDWTFLHCDVSLRNEIFACRDQVMKQFGRVDILLNAAVANAPTSFFQISEEETQRILSVTLVSLVYSCQAFGQVMVDQKSGSIINFASVASGPPLSKAFVYSMAKAGVVSITQNLAREWAPFNVRVNALRPGFFPTEWSMKNFIDDDRKANILGHTPMARFGKPEELVGAVLWLASDSASFVTGSIIAVDGGFTAMTI